MNRLIIIGAGGHGKVVEDAANTPCVFLDEDSTRCGVIGTPSELASIIEEGDGVVVAVGDNKRRSELLLEVDTPTTVIHRSATVSDGATIEGGCVVFANAVVNTGATLRRGCIINTGATVDHDCKLAECVHISPGANLGGNVEVGNCSWVGIGACVKNGVTIGKHVIIGAGAAVVSDVPDNTTVVGVPAGNIK
jgi:sugar O-acyltransferase (sialic acid O-acetyltransferase NeuD family)